jgi:hypothetical protein
MNKSYFKFGLFHTLHSCFLFISVFFLAVSAYAKPPQVLAEYPSGTFLENVVAVKGGAILLTSYFGKSLEIIEPGKAARTYAQLPAHPVGIISYRDGFLVSAHGKPFNAGPSFVETQQFLVLDAAGAVKETFAAPQARFLNGLMTHGGDAALVADSIAGVIWRVEPSKQRITPWLQDAALAQDPSAKEFRPGANGLKRKGNALLISNSSRGQLLKIQMNNAGQPAGAIKTMAQTGPIDDFLVTKSGDILFTTHSDQLKRLRQSGSIETVLPNGCDGCTSLARFRFDNAVDGVALLTTGGLLEGGTQPARVLFIAIRD